MPGFGTPWQSTWPVRIILVAPMLALALAACGTRSHSAAPSSAQLATALKGSPTRLAALHAQKDQLLTGGLAAFKARLLTLRGYPVVINKWASWCGPCQSEFPAFQRVSVSFGRRVAFIGLDGKDSNASAAAFLKRFPVSYPSYVDPDEKIAGAIQASTYYPQTVYYDRRGKQVYDHAGPYASAAALEQDIRRYLHL
jgi:cytochrome c biogenesis protein CcmG/thiol:disulfide interchange protein DsbE